MLAFAVFVLAATSGTTPRPFVDFTEIRPIDGVRGPGLYRVLVDDELWRDSRSPRRLGDVRIVGPRQTEVPWTMRPAPAVELPQPTPARLTQRTAPDGSLAVVADLGRPGQMHNHLRLQTTGSFVRTARVEGSDDGLTWRLLAEGALVFRLADAPPPNTHLEVSHRADAGRFVRLTLEPGPAATVTGLEVQLVAPGQPQQSTVSLKAEKSESDPATRTTRVWMTVEGSPEDEGVPIESLTFDVIGEPFERRAIVSAYERGVWKPIGSGVLWRPDPARVAGGVQDVMTISVERTRAKRFLVTVDDDERPLIIERATGAHRTDEIVFRAAEAGQHVLYVGSAMAPPPPLMLGRIDGPITDAHLRPLEPNPSFGRVAEKPVELPKSGKGTWAILAGVTLLAGAAVALHGRWRRRRRARPR
jgi:hypothetical protein